MAKAITFVPQHLRQEELLSVPQGSWPLHRRLPGLEGVDKGINTERKITEVCEEGRTTGSEMMINTSTSSHPKTRTTRLNNRKM